MKRSLIPVLIAVLFLLSGCRIRTTATTQTVPDPLGVRGVTEPGGVTGEGSGDNTSDSVDRIETPEFSEDAENQTHENPDATRREYDDNANAEVYTGAPHTLNDEGLDHGAPHLTDDTSSGSADKLQEDEIRVATQTLPAAEADKKGIDENAPDADSRLTYYTVLLEERTASLFECQRLNLYWENKEPYLTVFKRSPEHYWILQSGCYDVSSRLLEENLTVDAGWIRRKDPGVIVKIVDKSVLGFGVNGTLSAEAAYQSLVSRPDWNTMDAVRNRRVLLASEQLLTSRHLRTVLLVAIAKMAVPELYEDVNIQDALLSLSQESTGVPADGTFFYWPQT